MGLYINPESGTKEEWLEKNALELDRFRNWTAQELWKAAEDHGEGFFIVVLVTNPSFSAAGIAYDQRELRDFADPNDHRPKRWFLAHRTNLNTVQPQLEEYLAPA
jgi:hypothetical protein